MKDEKNFMPGVQPAGDFPRAREAVCPVCELTECMHLQPRSEPVVHYKIPPAAFSSDLQLAGYLGEIMHYSKTSGLALGSALYEHLQLFLVKHGLPYDIDKKKET